MAPTRTKTKSKRDSRGRLAWTRDMKLVVQLLTAEFSFSPEKRTRLFNSMFAEHIAECGLTDGVNQGRITSQYGMKAKHHKDWDYICALPTTKAEEERREAFRVQIRNLDGTTVQARAPANNIPRAPPPPATLAFRNSVASAVYALPETPSTKRVKSTDHQPTFRRCAATRPRAMVIVPRVTNVRQLITPKRTSRKHRPQKPKSQFQRPDGSTIMLPTEKIKDIAVLVNPVPEHKARPPLPGLLFRVCDEIPGCDRNSEEGFVARKYYKSNVVPHIPPKSTWIDPTDVFNHMDRKIKDTPFISTSSRLIWIVQLMLKGLKGGNQDGCVSVISTKALDKRSVFHARPFHDEIIKTQGFSNGAQKYRGTYEWMIWKCIPKDAIIHTFRAQELLDLVKGNDAIRRTLRFDILQLPMKSLVKTKIPLLRENSVRLDSDITVGIAQLCTFLHLDAHSPIEQLSHVVSDVVEGWVVQVEYREEAEWQGLASLFARKICKRSSQPVTLKERESVKLSFLDGVAWGCGEVNSKHKIELIAKKTKKAAAVGLASPALILANELDGAKLAILTYEKAQNNSLEHHHRLVTAALPSYRTPHVEELEEDSDDMDMDIDGDINMNVAFGTHDLLQKDDDDDGSTVFEIGDDGFVV